MWLSVLRTRHSVHDVVGLVPGLLSGLRIWRCHKLWHRRCSLDPELLWLWCRPAAAAPIQALAWELPYAAGAAVKKINKKWAELKGQRPELQRTPSPKD